MSEESNDLRWEMLDRLRKEVEQGDGDAILEALSLVAMLHLQMPAWLASAVSEAIAAYRNWDARTLDEAFGVHRPKGQHQDSFRSERRNALYVIAEVLRLQANGHPIDSEIFEAAGLTCSVGKTTAEKWYRKHLKGQTPTYLVAKQMAGLQD